ncbi:hypothetical protein P152DRAFT_478637 [Eremomyces bilateralis CBS 781.70]|uniref:Uncharacterized protein n=1 Tax=Eremomyces bilateralis CBS 781.70 TaxID=1392243 RepID=A0A6G1GDS7_9PEZI|nr:uncharacterized protein P152DRAFT_478637 [Eremomyces bilateralis CBS 781.70]KAF1816041.1 hypothetical protein P152DRAFT_478637 [Eremomyces bilateralis CBS 781.70]
MSGTTRPNVAEVQGRLIVERSRRETAESRLVIAAREIANLLAQRDEAQGVITGYMDDLFTEQRATHALSRAADQIQQQYDEKCQEIREMKARLPPKTPWWEEREDWIIEEDQFGIRHFVRTEQVEGVGEVQLKDAVPKGYVNAKKTVRINASDHHGREEKGALPYEEWLAAEDETEDKKTKPKNPKPKAKSPQPKTSGKPKAQNTAPKGPEKRRSFFN